MPAVENLKTVFNKLLIFCKCSSFKYLISSIFSIIKQRMFNMAEMNPYLMCSSCFQLTFNKRNIAKIFEYFIMCYCMSFLHYPSLNTCITFLSFMLLPTFPVIVPSGGSGDSPDKSIDIFCRLCGHKTVLKAC